MFVLPRCVGSRFLANREMPVSAREESPCRPAPPFSPWDGMERPFHFRPFPPALRLPDPFSHGPPMTERRMRAVGLLGVLLLPGLPMSAAAALTPAQSDLPRYHEVIRPGTETEPGLFDVHRDGDRYFFEIPDAMLGREMALLSRMAAMPAGSLLQMLPGGDRLNETQFMNYDTQVVRWVREGSRILLQAVSHAQIAAPADPVAASVAHAGFEPVIASFPLVTEGNGSSVIEVSTLYTGGNPNFGLDRGRRELWQTRGVDTDRSHLRFIRSFPTNIEVRNVLTYHADRPPHLERTGALSMVVNHSMILLPEEPMRPRLADPRVGMITVETLDYSDPAQHAKRKQFVQRFRLEPSDMEAFRRGELVDPVEPIVWYIDRATPEQWRPYIREGLEEWNAAFERAGFRNAVEAHLAPDDDPDFDLMDARYNVVRWVATPELSANAGPDVVDPRSGETIRAHMNMYHGLMKRVHWWSLTQTGPRNPAVQSLEVSTEEMGGYLRYVVSHEMGHALGYPHNQKANSAFPVDSLRSASFTDAWGNSGSVVGRTRFNYVAQPEDGDLRVHRSVGEYDKWAVEWAYRPIPDAASAEDERPVLDGWVRARTEDPVYRFGHGNDFDPYQQTESIGREWIEASDLGMRNLRQVVPNLVAWIGVEGETFDEIMQRYMQVLSQWNRIITRVTSAVGGLEEHLKVVGEEGPVYTPLPTGEQRRSLLWLAEHVYETPEWLLDADLLRRFEHVGAVERIRWYQVNSLDQLLSPERMERMIEQQAFRPDDAYTLAEMLDDLRSAVWREVETGGSIDPYRRNLQRGYLDRMRTLLNDDSAAAPAPPGDYRPDLNSSGFDAVTLRTPFHLHQSDAVPLIRDQLELLAEDIRARLDGGVDSRGPGEVRGMDRETRAHLRDALRRIDSMD
ncbi:MAG: DUF5117 domain-containing protein [Gemmatimonadales bacterium]|nr:MAG: DUF5117 domain-containing protein [Gemmatimonadales bacterium]